MNGTEVKLDDQVLPITRIGGSRLRSVRFTMNGRTIVAIEQNRSKPSRWGQLAKKGHQVVPFQDLVTKSISLWWWMAKSLNTASAEWAFLQPVG
jgi:hypothetical protein